MWGADPGAGCGCAENVNELQVAPRQGGPDPEEHRRSRCVSKECGDLRLESCCKQQDLAIVKRVENLPAMKLATW
jgi:hypothetical protein